MSKIKKVGVIGWPISHSLSPRLHNYWLKKYKIDGEYKAYPVEPENLSAFIDNLRTDKDFAGINLTIPHKEAAIKLLDEVDESVTTIGAVNTIIVKNGKLLGKNTDAIGFSKNIFTSLTSKNKALVLGSGGAAKAVVFALELIGFKEIIIINRTQKNAEELSLHLPKLTSVADWSDRNINLKNIDLLVNTTSLGMLEKKPLEIDLSLLPKTALVTDIVYNPLITPLLAQAQLRGNHTVDGLGMLLHQAVPAFKAWFAEELDGREPEVTEELRQYILSGKSW